MKQPIDDERFRELAKFEEEHDCTVISPTILSQVKKQQLFVLVFQDASLNITQIETGQSYDDLWNVGTTNASKHGGFWSIFNASGKFVDGNVVSR